MDLVGDYASDTDTNTDSDTNSDTNSEEHRSSALLPAVPAELLDKFHKAPQLPAPFHMRFSQVFQAPPGYFNCYCSLEFLSSHRQLVALDSLFNDFLMYSKMSPLFAKVPRFTPLYSKNGINNQLHVSLTSNVYITKLEKSAFQNELSKRLAAFKYTGDNNLITFNRVELFWNNDRTKLFATLALSEHSKSHVTKLHNTIMESLDMSAKESKTLGCSFNPDTLHLSFAETESVVVKDIDDDFVNDLNREISDLGIDEGLSFTYDSVKTNDGVSRLSLKIGDYEL